MMILFMFITFASGFALPSGSALSLVFSTVLTTILIVYMMAVLTDAYRQLRDENRARHVSEPQSDAAGV